MSERAKQVDDLTAFTDALLAGSPPEGDRPPLAGTVAMLVQSLRPQPVPESLQRAVRRRIVTEWARPQPSPARRFLSSIERPRQRWAWAAVAAMLVLALAAAWLLGSGAPVTGTVSGSGGWVILIALAVLGGVAAGAWWIARRK